MEHQKPFDTQEQTRSHIQTISRTNRTLSAFRNAPGGAIATLLMLAGSFYFAFVQTNLTAAFLLFAMAFITGFIVMQTVRLATKKIAAPSSTTPFVGTGTLDTVTAQPYPRTNMQEGEQVLGWLGPVSRYDFGGMSRTNFMGKETHGGAENTLLITSRQLIAIAFTQPDFDTIQQDGAAAVFSQLGTANTKASGQHAQTNLLNYKIWPKLIEKTMSSSLPAVLESHYQWGVPVSQITLVEVKNSFVNAGVQIHLADGTILKYSTLLKDQIAPFGAAAQAAGLTTKDA